MQTLETILETTKKCTAKVMGVTFSYIVGHKGDGYWIQIQALIPDTKTGTKSYQKGRKWDISCHAIDEEVVGTMFAALKAFLEHEAREGFFYEGYCIYGPHFPLSMLLKMAQISPEAKRDDDRV